MFSKSAFLPNLRTEGVILFGQLIDPEFGSLKSTQTLFNQPQPSLKFIS